MQYLSRKIRTKITLQAARKRSELEEVSTTLHQERCIILKFLIKFVLSPIYQI